MGLRPIRKQFKNFGFDVDTFYDRDAQSMTQHSLVKNQGKNASGDIRCRARFAKRFGTGNGWFDSNPQQVSIRLRRIESKLAYKLGVVILGSATVEAAAVGAFHPIWGVRVQWR